MVEVAQRALGERRERRQALEAVAEELGAHRLAAGRREDVDEAAANRELAALLDGVGALVAGLGQRVGELVERPLLPQAELDRPRPRRRRREPLDERVSRHGHEAAGGERVERPRPLADQVRGRLEAGAVRGAARRHERHGLAGQERGGRLGQGAGGVVVADEHRQAARLEARPRRPHGRDERAQDRLGGPRPGRSRRRSPGERGEVRVVQEIRQGKLRPSQGRVGPLPDAFRHRRREW